MSTETNEELVRKIKAGEDVTENMAKLWQQNKNFVYTIARKYGESEIDDLMQEGYLGMYRAVGNYELSAGTSFLSYAGFWIKQAIQRYHQDNKHIHIPVYAQENISKYKKFRNAYRMYFGKEPTREQICCYLGISYEALEKIESAAEAGKAGSMDKEIAGTDGITYGDMIADPKDNYESVFDDLEREQLKGILWGLVDGLPGRSPEVIRMRYQKDMTLDKIGEAIGITREAARQWQRKGITELRKPSRVNQIREFYNGEIYSRGVIGGGIGTFNRSWTSSTERTALDMIEGRF